MSRKKILLPSNKESMEGRERQDKINRWLVWEERRDRYGVTGRSAASLSAWTETSSLRQRRDTQEDELSCGNLEDQWLLRTEGEKAPQNGGRFLWELGSNVAALAAPFLADQELPLNLGDVGHKTLEEFSSRTEGFSIRTRSPLPSQRGRPIPLNLPRSCKNFAGRWVPVGARCNVPLLCKAVILRPPPCSLGCAFLSTLRSNLQSLPDVWRNSFKRESDPIPSWPSIVTFKKPKTFTEKLYGSASSGTIA